MELLSAIPGAIVILIAALLLLWWMIAVVVYLRRISRSLTALQQHQMPPVAPPLRSHRTGEEIPPTPASPTFRRC